MTATGAGGPATGPVPLIVDVDGTLIRTDLLHEAALQFVARHPLQAWRLVSWASAGKARVKSELASRIDCGADSLPLREEVVDAIRTAQAAGRPVYLASASDHRYVASVARRIGAIAGVFATEGAVNLGGTAKADRLTAEFGTGGYDYIGNGKVDVPVWQSARNAFVVADSRRVAKQVVATVPQAQVIARGGPRVSAYYRALRVHQWAKNLLIFLPLIAGHAFDWESVAQTLMGFFCFCMAASSAYIINDLLDLPGDRDHARKRNRPFASGMIPVAHGPALAALLLTAAVLLALTLPRWFVGVLTLYTVLTLAYSLVLKRRVLLDVITLGGLYTIRVLAGVAAVGVQTSPWLLILSLFLFLSLALVKRCAELVSRQATGETSTFGRGYRIEDLSVVRGLASTAGYGAVLVVALYIASPEVQKLYRHPERLWLICPLLLYWIGRVILIANRNELHDDPVIFALRDRVSWGVGLLAAVVLLVAI